jgi:hypothetical protein
MALRKIVLSLALVATMWTSVVDAQVNVMGSPDCAEWAQENKNKLNRTYDETWLSAYLSGLAIGSGTEFWKREETMLSIEQVYLWIDNYCRANPLENVSDGAMTLFLEVTME